MEEPLHQVLIRLGSSWPDLDLLSADEVGCWPEAFCRVLQREGLLVPAPLASSVDCDACYEGHAEPVETIEEPEGTAPRHYLVCPSVGRVQVDPERLRQWRLEQGGLARSLARMLSTRGRPREDTRTHLWELGNVELCGTAHDVLLARNGGWIETGGILAPSAPGWVNPIILALTGESSPVAGAVVVPLIRLLSVGQNGLVLDRRYLEAIASQGINPQPQAQYVFRKEGDYWTIGFEGRVGRHQATKGLEYIGYLVAQRGRSVPVLEVFHLGRGTANSSPGRSLQSMSQEELTDQGLRLADLGGSDAVLDAQAIQAYKSRLLEIEAEKSEANECGDFGKVDKLEEEREALVEELKAATGFGGRTRKTASGVERARSNVRMNISNAIERIARTDAALAHHLEAAIKTGRLCSYEPTIQISWEL